MIVGGFRDRMVDESVFQHVKQGLTLLGWFDADRNHKPVTFTTELFDEPERIEPNVIVMSGDSIFSEDAELGSSGTFDTTEYWFDVVAESDALGRQITGDIRTLAKGQFPALGFDKPVIELLDWSHATPVAEGWLEVVGTVRYRNRNHVVATSPARHWWTALVEVEDARV